MGKKLMDPPSGGQWIKMGADNAVEVPDNPILGFIEGDGVGPDIWSASRPVFDEAVKKSYGDQRKIFWWRLAAGEKCFNDTGASRW